jgi:hypothetical protein
MSGRGRGAGRGAGAAATQDPNAGAAAGAGAAAPQPNQAGAAAGAGAAAPPQVGNPAGIPQGGAAPRARGRNPAKWTKNVELDFSNKNDVAYYNKAVEKLEGDPYNGKNLPLFLKKVQAKAQQYNWMELLSHRQQANVQKDIVNNYGEISLTQVQMKAATYLGSDNRDDQDSDMIYHCLRRSITDEVFAKVSTNASRYQFVIAPDPVPIIDGPCFLKVIIDDTYASTKATTEMARENLSNLTTYMDSLEDCSISKFNEYVNQQLETLAAAGETTSELITNLFKGYARSKDKKFRNWIEIKKLAYFDESFYIHPNGKDFMALAEKHYQDSVTAKEWMKPDDDQKTILALQTKITEVEASAAKQLRRSNETRGGKRRQEASGWEWKRIPPRSGEPKTKKFKGKTYHWCTNHNLWCLHKPSECKLKSTKEEKPKSKGKNKEDKMKYKMRVYQTLFESSSEEEIEEGDHEDEDDTKSEGSNTSH